MSTQPPQEPPEGWKQPPQGPGWGSSQEPPQGKVMVLGNNFGNSNSPDSNGSSDRSTPLHDDWRLLWSYSCANFGEGNFIVSDDAFNVSVNEPGKGGKGEEFIDGGGRIQLKVISTCDNWTLKAVAP